MILKLDAGGLPVGWIHWQTAVTLYARKRVCWEAGEERFAIAGGINARTGQRSHFEIGSIIAVADRSRRYTHGVPMLTNRTLFQRDHNLCLYCGEQYNPTQLTRDHVMPASRGGETTWLNCVTACRECNQAKDARTPEEAGMKLLAQNPAHPNIHCSESSSSQLSKCMITSQMSDLESDDAAEHPRSAAKQEAPDIDCLQEIACEIPDFLSLKLPNVLALDVDGATLIRDESAFQGVT
ncbi:MAG: HNH endonuclease [Stagnimonas sp.]|nr:HNH endonuclease [Stagnimonas sp.]